MERQDSIADILTIADRFRNRQHETTTPYKTPAASKPAAAAASNGRLEGASAVPPFSARLGGLSVLAPANENGSSNMPPMSPSNANVRKSSWASRASATLGLQDNAENDVPSPTVVPSPKVQGFGSKSLSGSEGWAAAAAAVTPLQDQSNRQRQHLSPAPSPSAAPAAARTSFADRLSVAIPEFEELLSHGNDDVALNDDSSMLSNDGSSFTEDKDSRPRGNTRYHNTYSNPIISGAGISPALSPVRGSVGHFRGGTKSQSILRISQALRSKAKALLHGNGQQQTPRAMSPTRPSEAV